jgi:hypothetical protein
MDWFGAPCKGSSPPCGDFAVDDAFSAHLLRPLTGKSDGWKLSSLL